jgi:hypothetical protein
VSAQVQTLLAIVVSTLGLAGLIWRLLSPVLRISRYLHGEDGDERRGVPARPGILERQTATERRAEQIAGELAAHRQLQEQRDAEMRRMLQEIVAQLRNNGGSSVKDLVEKTLAAVTAPAQP